jgi:2,4-dienoyl-CoA reductase (NADPH2)
MLEEAGVDCLSVSAGNYGALEWMVQPVLFPSGCLVSSAATIKKAVELPVIVAGRITDPIRAENILQRGDADLVAFGRGLLADPDLPRKARERRIGEVRKCITCMSCQNELFRFDSPLACLINADAGHEGDTEGKAANPRKVLVVGAGPAGLEAARVSGVKGHKVTVWEPARAIGGRWSWLIHGYIAEQSRILKKLGVKIQVGKQLTKEQVSALGPGVVLYTQDTGPQRLPGVEGDRVLLADEVLGGKKQISGRVVVLGAGSSGCEVALHLVRRGCQVTIVESSHRTAYGLEMNTGRAIAQKLSQSGVNMLNMVKVKGFEEAALRCEGGDGGGEESVPADWVVLALGRQPTPVIPEWLSSLGIEVLSLPYCDQPVMAYRVAQEGAAIARRL